MKPRHKLSLILATVVLAFWGRNALAQESDIERLSGFAKHQKEDVQFDQARQQGERAYLEEEEQWDHKKERELEGYKKQSKDRTMDDDGPEFQADLAEKKKLVKQYEEDKETYIAKRTKNKSFDRQALGLPSEMQELGLDQERPRYDYRKRASFGATTKLGKNTIKSGGSSGGSSGGGGGSRGGGNSFPPPPAFDDFQDNGGYVPAPTINDDYMGDIPPPPPPPPPFGGGEGGMMNDFPPPPPPTFGEDPGDF